MMVGRVGEWGPARIVMTETVFAGIAAAVTYAMHRAYVRLGVGTTASPARTAAVVLAASYVGALAWTLGYWGYQAHLEPSVLQALTGTPGRVGPPGPALDGAVFHTALLLGWSALTLGLRYYAALGRERERALRAEAAADRAQLRALRYQVNPHFLFNALNGVSTLVAEGRAREATVMLARVSDFLRLTLDGDTAPEVPLAHEVEFTRRYLDIERARFGNRLRVRFEVDDDALSAEVPALVLQPLVENAVKHAVSPREEGASVAIGASRDGGSLVLTVSDDGPGLGSGPSAEGLGVGLANVRDRLRQLYGDAGRLDLSAPDGGGLRVRLRLPFRPSAVAALPATPVAAAPALP